MRSLRPWLIGLLLASGDEPQVGSARPATPSADAVSDLARVRERVMEHGAGLVLDLTACEQAPTAELRGCLERVIERAQDDGSSVERGYTAIARGLAAGECRDTVVQIAELHHTWIMLLMRIGEGVPDASTTTLDGVPRALRESMLEVVRTAGDPVLTADCDGADARGERS